MSTLRKPYAAPWRFLALIAVFGIAAISLLIFGPQKGALKEAAASLLPANKVGEAGPQRPVGSCEGGSSCQILGPEVTVD
jgi:hypothetical protein